MMQHHSKQLNIDTEQKTCPAESITGRNVLSAVHTLQGGKPPREGILSTNVWTCHILDQGLNLRSYCKHILALPDLWMKRVVFSISSFYYPCQHSTRCRSRAADFKMSLFCNNLICLGLNQYLCYNLILAGRRTLLYGNMTLNFKLHRWSRCYSNSSAHHVVIQR